MHWIPANTRQNTFTSTGNGEHGHVARESANIRVACIHSPPGSLILTMLTKDEAENLDKTLPKWCAPSRFASNNCALICLMTSNFYFRRAKVIDYWVIGIDDANTDNSPEVIMKHVGHIPGEIVTVSFSGSPGLPWLDFS